jgi:hypothetical protein
MDARAEPRVCLPVCNFGLLQHLPVFRMISPGEGAMPKAGKLDACGIAVSTYRRDAKEPSERHAIE